MKLSFLERLTSKKSQARRLKNKIIDYLSRQPEITDEQRKVLAFLKTNEMAVFPYPFIHEYDETDIELKYDPQLDLFYTTWQGKKLYCMDGIRKSRARKYFNSLRLEQDPRSPHRYLTDTFAIQPGDVVVDIGAAEGNFSLSIIDQVEHAFLFEPEPSWQKPLKETFAPWSDKVTIVPKFASDRSSDTTVSLDEFFNESQQIDFIKLDVEGAEEQILKGAAKLIQRQKRLKIAVCTYHRQEDATVLDALLKNLGFQTQFSDGYMLYYYGRTNEVKEPYLRRAIVRAVKQ